MLWISHFLCNATNNSLLYAMSSPVATAYIDHSGTLTVLAASAATAPLQGLAAASNAATASACMFASAVARTQLKDKAHMHWTRTSISMLYLHTSATTGQRRLPRDECSIYIYTHTHTYNIIYIFFRVRHTALGGIYRLWR
jgi:hypothetical protein